MQSALKRLGSARAAPAGLARTRQDPRVLICPTRAGLLFGCVLLLILFGSINYSLTLGYVLAFLLGSFAITGMLHTFRNVAGLRITASRTPHVYAGEVARFGIAIHNEAPHARCRIALATADGATIADVPGESTALTHVPRAATRRGRFALGVLRIESRFPVGLFRAWYHVDPNAVCVVYPRPGARGCGTAHIGASDSRAGAAVRGQEDFAGLRAFRSGDSPRHVAWKAAARDRLMTKQFSGSEDEERWLRWDALPAQMDVEQKLSCLARAVLDCRAAGLRYGLRLPHAIVPISSGDRHSESCLEALALHDARRP
jgi:uncharacterized protein (DUF58 family)